MKHILGLSKLNTPFEVGISHDSGIQGSHFEMSNLELMINKHISVALELL